MIRSRHILNCLVILSLMLTHLGFAQGARDLEPFDGVYDVGGGSADFPDVAGAAIALAENGVTGPAVFRVFGGTYEGAVVFDSIPGASDVNPITFIRADSLAPLLLNSTDGDSAVVVFTGAAHVTFDGMDIAAAGAVPRGVHIGAGSHHIVLRNGSVNGSVTNSSDGIRLRGPGCDHHHFENLNIRRFGDAFDLDGLTTPNDGNLIQGCIIDSVRRGIVAHRQDNLRIDGNDISVNAGSVEEVDGIYIGTLWPQDTVIISANQIHGIHVNSAYAVAIRVKPDSAQAVIRAFNNFIYDFQNSGSSQIRAVYASSGNLHFFANSIHVNNSPATASAYTLYLASTAANGQVALYNNILLNQEQTGTAYNIFTVSTTIDLLSDYNIVHGTGTNYRVGRFGNDCNSLADWQAATGGDAHTLSGNPGFVSATDLHLSPANGLAHLNGAILPGLTDDIDGDSRMLPPDRGADEYQYLAPENEVAVLGFYNATASYPEITTVDISLILQNRGSEDQREAFLELLFNEEMCAAAVVRIDAARTDTVIVPWTTPSAGNAGLLSARCSVVDDAVPANDTASVFVIIVPTPLVGSYSIDPAGGGYPSFTSAVSDLVLRGVSGPVTLNVAAATYEESVTITQIPGTSAVNRITFIRDPLARTDVILSSNTGPATLWLNGADFVIFDNIDITAIAPNLTAVLISNDADENCVRSGAVTGSSLLSVSAHGINISGGGNDQNRIESISFSGAHEAVELQGIEQTPDLGNVVERCTFNSSRIAIRTAYQREALLSRNTIHTGYPDAAQPCAGIVIGPQNPEAGIIVEQNNITGGRANASGYGIRTEATAGSVLIRNNFVSDWSIGTGTLCGIAALSGTIGVSFNSLWMNDVSASSVVVVMDSGATLNLHNNILFVSEADSSAACIGRYGGMLNSDYNCFFGDTANSRFHLAANLDTLYPTWLAWNAATGLDSHSVVGDPGFVSPTDLHIISDAELISGRGLADADVIVDIDQDLRDDPPDLGADEYDLINITHDFRIFWLTPPDTLCAAGSIYNLVVHVVNAGDSAQANIPVRFFVDSVLYAEDFVSLAAGDTDTVSFGWTAPNVGLAFSTLEIRCDLPNDQLPVNNSLTTPVTVIGPPMSGEYAVGNIYELSSLSVTAQHLLYRGVATPVTLRVLPGQYVESVCFFPIPGASDVTPVVIQPFSGNVRLAADSGTAVIEFNGVNHLTLRGLSIAATDQCLGAVLLHSGADRNRIEGCALRAPDSLNSTTFGARIELDGNDNNVLQALIIDGAFTGIALQNGPSTAQSIGNEIHACTIRHARYGIFVDNQVSCSIYECDIQPGSPSPVAAACYGVYIAALGNNGSVSVFNNRLHGFADGSLSVSNRAIGVYSAPAADAAALIYNNFIYDFTAVTNLKLNPLYLSQGNNTVLHNSILITDAPTANEIAGIYVSSGNEHWIQNNIIVCDEHDVPSFGILSNVNTLASDYNDLFGDSPLFATARAAGITYPSLADWQAAGYDLHSIAAAPGFVGDHDLHITSTDSTVSNRGLCSPLVLSDIDLDARADPPDLGADEYTVGILPAPVMDVTIYPRSGTLLLRWSLATGATAYRVYAAATPDVQPIAAHLIATVTINNFVDTNLAPPAKFYVITAVSAP